MDPTGRIAAAGEERSPPGTLRLFVSSTFSDFTAERNALLERVFPELERVCRRRGRRFQAVDLRWGVGEEVARDQRTTEVCLEEIGRCRYFLLLVGDRYGWRPPPASVPEGEFEVLARSAGAGRLTLERWYRRDDNACPTVWRLRPRAGDPSAWKQTERELSATFAGAAARFRLPAAAAARYGGSVTEQEALRARAVAADAGGRLFCVLRSIRGEPPPELRENEERLAEYVDLLPDGTRDDEARERGDRLREGLEELPEDQLFECGAGWTEDGITQDHLEELCEWVRGAFTAALDADLEPLGSVDPVAVEAGAHRRFGRERSRHFIGRTALLDSIRDHVRRAERHPLAVLGEPGSGKSALLARAAADLSGTAAGAEVVVRFLGATPGSTDGRELLAGLCREIAAVYGVEPAVPQDYAELVRRFEELLREASAHRPLVVVLDGLDQLSEAHQARSLVWLPPRLPEHVSAIVSTGPGDCRRALEDKLPPSGLLTIEPLPPAEGEALLYRWLGEAGRSLQERQRRRVLDGFRASGLPLYLRLAFEEARRWSSHDEPAPLPADVPGLVRRLFDRLGRAEHGELLVRRSLANLAASRAGLSEEEMLDLLSADPEYFEEFSRRAKHLLPGAAAEPRPPPERPETEGGAPAAGAIGPASGRRLPQVLWSRLYFDLEPYLAERQADGVALLGFFHRQLQEVAEEVFLPDPERRRRHRALARYFAGQPLYREAAEHSPNVRKVSELPYHQVMGAIWEAGDGSDEPGTEEVPGFDETLLDLRFLQAKAEAGMIHDAISDFQLADAALGAAPGWDDPHRALREPLREVAAAFDQESAAALERPRATAQQLYNNLIAHGGLEGPGSSVARRFLSRPEARPWWRRANEAPETSTPRALRRTLAAHRGAATALAPSADGELVASAGSDGQARVWRMKDGALLSSFEAHRGGVTAVAWVARSAGEPTLATAGADAALALWEWRSGRLRAAAHALTVVRALVWLPEADLLVSAGDDRRVRGWNAATLEPGPELAQHEDRALCLAGLPGGAVLSAGEDRTLLLSRAAADGALAVFRGSEGPVRGVAASADGRWAVSGGDDRLVRWWDLPARSHRRALAGHEKRITCVAAGRPAGGKAAGEWAVSGGEDASLRLWDARSGAARWTLHGHVGAVRAVTTGARGAWFVSAGDDGTVRLWDPERAGAGAAQGVEHRAAINALDLDGDDVVSASDDHSLKLWRRSDAGPVRSFRGHLKPVTAAVLLPGGRLLSASADGTLKLWSTASGELRRTIGSPLAPVELDGLRLPLPGGEPAHAGGVLCLARLPGGRVLSGGADGRVREWEPETGEAVGEYRGARGPVTALLAAAEPAVVVALGPAFEASVWERETRCHRGLAGHRGRIRCGALGPGGLLATGGLDGQVLLWDLAREGPPRLLEGHGAWVTCVALHPEGRWATAGGRDGRVLVWDLENGGTAREPRRHGGPVRGVAFAEGRALLSYAADGWLVAGAIDGGEPETAVHLESPITALHARSGTEIWAGTQRGALALLRHEGASPAAPAPPAP